MRIVTHGASSRPAHPDADATTSRTRPTEGSRLLTSGRLGSVLVAAAHAAVAAHAERVARETGVPTTLDRGRRA